MSALTEYKDFLLDRYSNLPQGRYINLIVLRETKSETIFRTEGSGEPLNREFVHAGLNNDEIIPRVVISVGSSRVDLQACKLEYSIVSPK